jgi:energy-coupling factor transporter ATP-binding protein EcfA2
MQKHITIVCFAGPSGSGKSELVQRLLDMYPDNVCKWKQATTRAKRGPDDDYVFMTKPMYDVVRSTLTCRTDFNGNSYGTFPEPLVDDSAVLTIADAMGLADLEQDVAEHNKRVQAGHPGKLGSYPVKLVRVLMVYDLSDAEIEKRGGTRGGTRDAAFLQGEIDRLKAFQFESIVDSTGGWPDPVEFFDSVVWPAIANPFDGETADDLRQEIRALCGDIITAAKDIEDLDALRIVRSQLGYNVLGYMDEWKQSMPEPEDDIDMLLAGPTVYSDGAAQMHSSADLDAAEQIYSASLARAADEEAAEGAELTQMDYEVYPQALEHVIRKVAEEFKGDLIVTENGIATADDTRRVAFIRQALDGVQHCIADGIPVKGYFHWSLMDNFEWQKGYAMQFGLIAVNRETMERTAKPSLAVLGSYTER